MCQANTLDSKYFLHKKLNIHSFKIVIPKKMEEKDFDYTVAINNSEYQQLLDGHQLQVLSQKKLLQEQFREIGPGNFKKKWQIFWKSKTGYIIKKIAVGFVLAGGIVATALVSICLPPLGGAIITAVASIHICWAGAFASAVGGGVIGGIYGNKKWKKRNAIQETLTIQNKMLENQNQKFVERNNKLDQLNQKYDTRIFCIFCCERERNVCFSPCKHTISCHECAENLPKPICPMCRTIIKHVDKVIIS